MLPLKHKLMLIASHKSQLHGLFIVYY